MNEDNTATTDATATDVTTGVIETKVETPTPTKVELLKELSKDLGFDAFNPKEVRKQFDALKEFQDSQKSEQDKLQEKLDSYKDIETSYKAKEESLNAQIAALELGLPSENLTDAIALAKINMTDGQSIKEGLALVKEKYGSMFTSKTAGVKLSIGTQSNNKGDVPQVETDEALARYMANKKKK